MNKRIVFALGRTALTAAALGAALAHNGPPLKANACATIGWNNATGYYCADDPVYEYCSSSDPQSVPDIGDCCGGGDWCH